MNAIISDNHRGPALARNSEAKLWPYFVRCGFLCAVRPPRFLKWSVVALFTLVPWLGGASIAHAADDDDSSLDGAPVAEAEPSSDADAGSAEVEAPKTETHVHKKKAHAKKHTSGKVQASAKKTKSKKDKKHKSISTKVASTKSKKKKDKAHDKTSTTASHKVSAADKASKDKKKTIALSKPAVDDDDAKASATKAEGGDTKHRLRKKVHRRKKQAQEASE